MATVEAIYDATIQVLLKKGADRLTTVHVARRAGVSVGTLYQYFPNKQALLFAVLERHMQRVVEAVEEACATNHFQPLEVMVDELMNRFIDAKLVDRDTSVALYRIAAEAGGADVESELRLSDHPMQFHRRGVREEVGLPPAKFPGDDVGIADVFRRPAQLKRNQVVQAGAQASDDAPFFRFVDERAR